MFVKNKKSLSSPVQNLKTHFFNYKENLKCTNMEKIIFNIFKLYLIYKNNISNMFLICYASLRLFILFWITTKIFGAMPDFISIVFE